MAIERGQFSRGIGSLGEKATVAGGGGYNLGGFVLGKSLVRRWCSWDLCLVICAYYTSSPREE